MAKNTKEQPQVKTKPADHPLIPQKYQHFAAMFFLYLCLIAFFHSIVFDGKTYQSADTIASHSWETLLKEAQSDGIYPLWNPYIFCGMPGYASLTFSLPRVYDFTSSAWGTARSILGYIFLEQQAGVWLLFYLVYGIGIYLLAFYKLQNKPIALIVALMATYATYVAILIMIGHVTKIAVLAWFPYVFLIVEKLREKFNLLYALLLTILVRLMIEPGHVQYIFYIYLALGSYLLFLLIRGFIKKENWKGIVLSGVSLACATLIAFLMGADQHLSTLEYNPYSMRGSNPIVSPSAASQTKTIEGGLDYEYATSWSLSPGELMTFLVPSWYGFGQLPYQGPLTGNRLQKLNFYWGPQPFVDGPQFMGVIVVVFAIIGFFKNRKNPFVQFMAGAIIFSLLVSFGKEMPLVYDLMYRFFPMFNKFRLPLLILMLVQFFTPLLAGYGIISFLTEEHVKISSHQNKQWKYGLGALVICFFIVLVFQGLIKEIYGMFFPLQEAGKSLARSYGQLHPTAVGMIYDFVVSAVVMDILVGCALLFVVFGALYLYRNKRIQFPLLFGVLIIAVLVDLWRVASKPSEPRAKQEGIQAMPTPGFVKVLQQDTTLYRVLKIRDGQPIYDNSLAYWKIQNAYGYQGAKMRAYQDMADVAGLGNPLVWQLMNIKYLISNREETDPNLVQIYSGPDATVYGIRFTLPRAFYVKTYERKENLEILNKIAGRTFDPRETAYGPDSIKIDSPLENASAQIVDFSLHHIALKAVATGTNLLFISETYYPKGWKAFIDGQETKIYQLNYLFRGVVIPPGTHTIEMRFESDMYTLGKNLSLATNIIVFLGFCVQGIWMVRKKVQKK